jgi:membrane protein
MASLTLKMVRESAAGFIADDASTHAAAIAYSAVFAIAPLLIVAIGIAGQMLGIARVGHQQRLIEDHLFQGLASSVGSSTSLSVRSIVDASFQSHQGSVIAQSTGWAIFIVAASGLFLSLQNALNRVWRVRPKQRDWRSNVRERLVSGAMLLGIGIVILCTTALNSALTIVWDHFTAILPFPGAGAAFASINWIISFAVMTGVFAVLYKVLPETHITWNDVAVGAAFTAFLFVVGEGLLGLYISRAGLANGYGTGGALVIVLVWVYYSAVLILFGAELSRVYTERHGSRAGSAARRRHDDS